MKENVWAKTILTVYKFIERICGAIDKLVENKAMASFYVCSSSFASSSIINVADKIIELSERKKVLINLKVLTLNALKKCDALDAKILIEKYIEGNSPAEISARYNLPLRSYFRKVNLAENHLTRAFEKLGYSETRLSEYLANEKWILDVYAKFSTISRESLFELNESRLQKLALI